MNEYGLSLERTMKKFQEFAEFALKNLNEGLLKPITVSTDILFCILNFTRMFFVTYKHNQDGYVHPEKITKSHIISLLIDPITIHKE